MTFDWHMLYHLHTVILDNSQVFGGVPCKAQLCNFSKWFFGPLFGVVPIWELWQFCYVRIGPPKYNNVHMQSAGPHVHWHGSQPVCTTSPLQFFLYRARCRASILVQRYRMNKPLATIMRALFTRGPLVTTTHLSTPSLTQSRTIPSALWT